MSQLILILATIMGLLACAKTTTRYPTPGEPGTSCTVTVVAEGSLISCTDGTSSLVPNGEDGADAVPVTVVTLCVYTTGHKVHKKSALCIDNQLYTGHNVLIPVGTYRKGQCSYTVQPNCVIN